MYDNNQAEQLQILSSVVNEKDVIIVRPFTGLHARRTYASISNVKRALYGKDKDEAFTWTYNLSRRVDRSTELSKLVMQSSLKFVGY